MPVTKTRAKKTAKKRAGKAAFEDRWEAIERGFVEFQKGMRELRENQKRTEEAHKRTEEALGRLSNRQGDMAEYMLVPGLPEKFGALGFTFSSISHNKKIRLAEHDNIRAEIDAFLENGSQAMAVEVKVTLRPEDVNDHVRRMEKIRQYADINGDRRQFYGAVAALVMDEDVKLHALRQGFYVIEPSGEDVKITAPAVNAKAW
jgi:septation ring formation regulator EzrA